MNDCILLLYMDMITYPCPNLDDGLANLLLVRSALDILCNNDLEHIDL